jgi:Domain of unknown function (DUF1906)/Bacterial SH3 domain
MFVIETPWNCTKYIPKLKAASVDVIIRYYTSKVTSTLPEKRLGADEAKALSKAGFQLGVVYQQYARDPASFSKSIGLTDGEYAHHYAANVIGQPDGSAVYFGVDYDASDAEIKNSILPYFEGVNEAFAADSSVRYDIGVYGSWKVCDRGVKAGLVKFAWLAQSTGWGGKAEYKKYAASKAWNLKQGFPKIDLGGLDYDPNEPNEDKGPFGQFSLPVSDTAAAAGDRFLAAAKPTLNLRSGPGLNFGVIRTIPFGTILSVVRRDGDWAYVDIDNDGGIDGVVHGGFLKPT